jgi:hypothetical protein
VAALQGGALVVHFTNRKNAPLLFSTRLGTRPIQRGSDEAIVGVEFLRLFRKILVLSVADGTVLLIDSLADLTPA